MNMLYKIGLSVLLFSLGVFSTSVSAQGIEDAFKISQSGVIVQKFRLRLIAENIANLITLKTETGLPYAKKIAVLEAGPNGVRVKEVARSSAPFPKYFDPSLPQSDSGGFFFFPNVNLPDEYIDLGFTENMFEANVMSFKTAKTMYQQSLDMLK